MNNLLLFSDTFPYGMAEPFLQQELPYLASRFSKVEIVPLYLPEAAAGAPAGATAGSTGAPAGSGGATAGSAGAPAGSAAATAAAPHRPLPDNVSLCKPLLRCNHKSVKGLLRYGLFGGRSSCGGSCGGSGSSSRSSSCGSSGSGGAMRGGLVRECFRKGAWRSLSKLRVLLSYWLIMRAFLQTGRLWSIL